MKRLETEWSEVSTPTPSATADAIFKQIQAGAVPPRSDVTLSKLGYTAAERARLAQDTLADPGEAILAEVANSLLAKEARANKAIAEDLQPDVAAAPTVPTNDPTAS
jgi:hypothetical protein